MKRLVLMIALALAVVLPQAALAQQTIFTSEDECLEALEIGTGVVYEPRFLGLHRPLAAGETEGPMAPGYDKVCAYMRVVGGFRWVIQYGNTPRICDAAGNCRRKDCGNENPKIALPRRKEQPPAAHVPSRPPFYEQPTVTPHGPCIPEDIMVIASVGENLNTFDIIGWDGCTIDVDYAQITPDATGVRLCWGDFGECDELEGSGGRFRIDLCELGRRTRGKRGGWTRWEERTRLTARLEDGTVIDAGEAWRTSPLMTTTSILLRIDDGLHKHIGIVPDYKIAVMDDKSRQLLEGTPFWCTFHTNIAGMSFQFTLDPNGNVGIDPQSEGLTVQEVVPGKAYIGRPIRPMFPVPTTSREFPETSSVSSNNQNNQ